MTIVLASRICHFARFRAAWSGRWLLEVKLEGAPPTGRQTVQWGNARLVGTVLPSKSGEVVGEGIVTIVGGAGWHETPPAAWLVDTMAAPSKVAAQLAQSVGETLSIGAGSLREGRAAYARPNAKASLILKDLLAVGAVWWVGLDGTTNTATDRPTSSSTAEVLGYEPDARRVKLDIDDPSQALPGMTLAARGERLPIDLRIRSVLITASDKGIECWAECEGEGAQTKLSEHVRNTVEGITAHSHFRGATVQSQDASGRVSLRLEGRDKELADPLPIAAWCGVPGVSAKVFSGTRTMLGFDRADPTNPFAALWSPLGQPGHVPDEVLHEAFAAVRMVQNSPGKVQIGTPAVPVALAPYLTAYLQALELWALQVDLVIAPIAAAVPTYPASVTARTTAAANIANITATKLEAI